MDDKSLKKVIAKVEYEKGKTYLQNIENNPRRLFKPYMIAASIIVLFGLFFVWNFTNNSKIDSQKLYAEHFSVYPNIVAPIVRNVKPKTLEERAFYSFETKDYKNALLVFDSLLLENKSDKQKVNFYKANVLLEIDEKPNKAISLLKDNLIESNPWEDKNLWYLTLAYLKNNDTKKAKETLQQLEGLNSEFKLKQRLRLLKQLNGN